MKIIITLLCILPSLAWALSCPPSPASFQPKKAKFSKVFLVPGAGADEDDLYLGHIHYGKYYSVYAEELKKRNIPFEVVSTFPNGNEGVDERVENLSSKILKEKKPVLVIGHSVGGLVSRLALRDPAVAAKVAATITISAPHQGTPFVDWLLKDGGYSEALGVLSKAFGFDLDDKEYLQQISVAEKDQWNTPLDHAPHIHNIFSVINALDTKDLVFSNPLFAISDNIIRRQTNSKDDIVSDGLIPLKSQVWGECLLAIEKNHGSIIGKDFFHSATKDVLPAILGKLESNEIVFKP